MLPGHGPIVEDPSALLQEYLDHRQERERQVLEQLEAGVGRVETMVSRIYPGLLPALVPQARESVTAHLLKLEAEGRARQVDRDAGWALVG